ncbi:unnamed protein product [Rotaria sp. Silwood1]|nr:unnamed protein product [Rotaria sp. Silwood1]CAF1510225.1 unnamed protein product [Rotaria sp. Silwood1]CAF3553049.1 unnamed protein product [Rotaria sp. Silwood1]CAF3631234.1 unnamed protein product [Rotaria sp. Silwood1]CAF3640944.1 unnamed protein product [Rotaria sp. Silwood1]
MFCSTIIETTKCSCSCCFGNSCKPESLPSLDVDRCSMCNRECITAYPAKCGLTSGATVSSCGIGISIGVIVGIVVGIIAIIVIVILILLLCRRRLSYR